MSNKKIIELLLHASKEGIIKGGNIPCGAALSSGQTKLIIIAKDSKPGTKVKFGQLGFKYDVKVVTFGLCSEFTWITNRKDIDVMAIIENDEFAKEVLELIEHI